MFNSRHWEGSVSGSMSVEWLEGGGYVIARSRPDGGGVPNSVTVMGPREGTGELVQHYFDSRGVARVYEMTLENDEWTLFRDGPEFAQRFTGRLSPDGQTIEGTILMAEDHETFIRDFDLRYTRIR